MTNPSNIEQVVMRRVGRIRVLRTLTNATALALATGVAALWGIGREVWVARVFENAPHELARIPQFYFAAFTRTELIVQALAILVILSIITLASTMARLMVQRISIA